MVLAGQRPEVVMEIASRALAFWSYQCHQERTYQEYMANKNKERNTQLEQYYEQILSRTQTETKSLKAQMSAAKKELESIKKRYSEVSDKLMERNRQYQKLQMMYDALRRRTINASSFETAGKDMSSKHSGASFDIPISTGESVLGGHPVRDTTMMQLTPTRPEQDFYFCPAAVSNSNTPTHGGDNRSSIQHRFNLGLGTPNDITRRLNDRK